MAKISFRQPEQGSQNGQPINKSSSSADALQARPKKRKYDGNKDSETTQPEKKRQRNISEAVLLEEIKALGGDESDLKLIEDVSSDSEEDIEGVSGKPQDESLLKEIAKFAEGLGFENLAQDSDFSSSKEEDQEADAANQDQEEDGKEHEREGDGVDDDDDDSNHSDPSEESGQETSQEPKPKPELVKKGNRSRVVQPRPDWFNEPAVSNPNLPNAVNMDVKSYSAAINSLKSHARSVWERDAAEYTSSRAASSSHRFLSTIMASGTVSDKVSALTLAIQDSPFHNAKALESLVSMSAKRSRSQALVALGSLVDLFGLGLLLPPDRRLRYFCNQPGLLNSLQQSRVKSWEPGNPLPGKLTNTHLVCWMFEDFLKDAYFKIMQTLETWLNDEVDHSRVKALDFVYVLLKEKPEQEANLLRLLVNKLGDLHKNIASRASYLILKLLESHPAMQAVVIKAIEQDIMLRPNQSMRPVYYAIITLNQTVLNDKEPHIADALQRVYFSTLIAVLKGHLLPEKSKAPPPRPRKKDKGGQKMGKDDDQTIVESCDKLVSALLTGVNRAIPFCKIESSTLESHLETLFRIAHSSNFNTSIQALMLIQQISSARGVSTDRFYRTLYASLLDPRLVDSTKQALYLNLLYKSLKTDVSTRRIKAFIKRMVQTASLHSSPFICGIIYLILELQKVFPDLKVLITEPEASAEEEGVTTAAASEAKTSYDGRKRDPEFSNAHESCLWEIPPFTAHFHPSVAIYAQGLLAPPQFEQGRKEEPLQKPDLASHTLIAFLDRFVFRNPKTSEHAGMRGTSIMQPALASSSFLSGTGGGGSRLVASENAMAASSSDSVNTPAFWSKNVGDVAAQDVFFHDYFAYKGKKKETTLARQQRRQKEREEKAARAGAPDDGDEDDGDEEDEEQDIWNALVSSAPELRDADMADKDDDEDLADLDSISSFFDDFRASNDNEPGEDSEKEETVELDARFFEDPNSTEDVPFQSAFSSDDDEEEESKAKKKQNKEKKILTTPSVAKTMVGHSGKKMLASKRRKLMKGLPMFATADEYEDLLGIEEGDKLDV